MMAQGETGVVYKGLLLNWKDEPLQLRSSSEDIERYTCNQLLIRVHVWDHVRYTALDCAPDVETP